MCIRDRPEAPPPPVVASARPRFPVETSVHAPPTAQPRPPSADKTPPLLPGGAEKTPPPLPDAPPPSASAATRFPMEEAFTVEGGVGEGWTFIDDEFSRDLDNILEEDPESGAETGYVSGDAGYGCRGVGYSSDDDTAASSLRKRQQFVGHSEGVSDDCQAVVKGNLGRVAPSILNLSSP